MSNVILVDNLRSIGFAALTTNYQSLGSAFTHPMRILHFINNTDGNMLISFDGVNDNLFLPSKSFVLYDITTNKDKDERSRIHNNTQVRIKYSTAPTEGDFYLAALYGKGE